MCPEVVTNIAKNYNPDISLDPVSIFQTSNTICLPYEEEGDEERRHGGHQSENQVLQLREPLVELEGDDDAEAEREPEGREF
jgi:hypothetical protein